MTTLYTVESLSDEQGINRDRIYDLLLSGELRGFKIGRSWRIHPDDWTAYIDRQRGLAS